MYVLGIVKFLKKFNYRTVLLKLLQYKICEKLFEIYIFMMFCFVDNKLKLILLEHNSFIKIF